MIRKMDRSLQQLEGASVLVNPGGRDLPSPPVGMRGTLHVTPGDEVTVELQFAAMFYGKPRTEIIHLGRRQVEELLASESAGTYSVTLPGRVPNPDPARE